MKDKIEKQPPHPELLDCPACGEDCAWTGCFIKNAINRIDPKKIGKEKAEVVKNSLIDMAYNCGCKNLKNL
jgi:hypothetical protein